MTARASRRPVDYEALKEGDVFDEEFLARATGAAKGTKEHALRSLGLVGQIESYFRSHSIPLMAKLSKGSLYIIAGNAMVETIASRQGRAIRSIAKGVVDVSRVDPAQLDEAHARKADGIASRGGRLLEAARMLSRGPVASRPLTDRLGKPSWASKDDKQ